MIYTTFRRYRIKRKVVRKMPNIGKTAKQLNEQKLLRMKLILEKLRERTMGSSDLGLTVFGHNMNRTEFRSLQNYLSELIGLGLVERDTNLGIYSSNDNKIIFQSKHDYDIAFKHSQRLVLSTRDTQRLDFMFPPSALRILVFWDDNITEHDPEDGRFLQHLKTGYYDIFQLMETYRQKVKELGLSPRFDIPHIGENPDRAKNISQNDLKELENLKAQLIGKVYLLVDCVKNGSPLKGSCETCPGRYLAIKNT
jgi:hypothetical protein